IKLRMLRFKHVDSERDAVLSFLVEHDRIPKFVISQSSLVNGKSEPSASERIAGQREGANTTGVLDPATALAAGHQLVSSRGFGCMSCHTVGKHQPRGVAVNARGSDLLKVGERLRHEWFLRWMHDPARIVPGMEMP